jgi:iron-sulfur cluster assembly protein
MNLIVTEKALKELRHIMADQNFDANVTYARLTILGGGCSGFQHKFHLDENFNEKTDILVEIDGLKFVTDKRSALYLDGTTVDFLEDLNKRGFKMSNPSIKSTCGCGSSFSM